MNAVEVFYEPENNEQGDEYGHGVTPNAEKKPQPHEATGAVS
jgi:hypothetical protein